MFGSDCAFGAAGHNVSGRVRKGLASKRLAAPVSLLLFGAFTAGCDTALRAWPAGEREAGAKASGVDAAFLDDTPRVSLVAPKSKEGGPLLSVTRGTRFVSVRAVSESNTPNTLETVVGGEEVVNGVRGVRYDTRLNGKPFQSEVYALRRDGSVLGLATGPNASVALVPPLPIIGSRSQQAARQITWTKWRGKLVPRQTVGAPVARPMEAEALCRVVGGASAIRTADTNQFIKTGQGTYSALRVDLVVSLLPSGSSGENASTRTRQTTLWVARGVGVIQQSYPSGPVAGQNAVWTLQHIDAPSSINSGANAR